GPDAAAPGPAAEQADAPAGLAAQPAPDASLESGGGACAGPQQPTTEAEPDGGGAGGCAAGGGGAAGVPAQQQEEKAAPPDVSGQDPQSALATAASLPPDQMATTLDGVDGSVDRTVGEKHAALQAAPPAVQRPSGAPQTQSGTPEAAPPAEAVAERLERVGPQGADGEQQKAERKQVEGRNPGDRVGSPHVADDPGNQVSPQEVQQAQVAVDGVPSTDPALNTTVGAAPKVELTGESDPARTDRQAAKLKESSGRILGVGRQDAAKPMGEDRIYPDVPKETLTASVPGGGRRKGGGAGAGRAAGTKPGIGIVTQQERGPQIQAAVGQGQGQLGSAQAEQKQGEAEARRQNQAEIDQEVADNAQAQAGERGDAAAKVTAEREQWRTEQDQKITGADQDADAEHKDKSGQIDKKRTEADKDVQDRQQQDNQKIQDKRKEAEEKAQKEKDRKKEESEGWWGWVKSKVKAAFDALVEAVTKVFDFFRGLINDIIDGFRKFANWAIDQARKFAVDLINKLADALIKICDVLLAAFPELRDKFRKKIEEWRDKAVAKVNEWADKLKNAVNKLLDVLAAGLNALLDALEAGLKAAIEAVRKAVLDAIDFVQKAIAVFGEFAALIGDIAPDPGGWLKKLGSAAIDGIQHYLWGAIKSAVRTWFNEKVESVVGLTSTIVNVLVKGCISMAQIGRMAWQAIVAALPGMIVSIVVEKLVSLIVPAAGAIMAIIQGLVAAWNTISKIVAAIGKFVAFLKAVKSGSAACLFADAVAAGVVALLDFISNFLLSKLKGAGKAVGTKLKGIAQRILKGLAKAGKGARKAAGNAVNKARASLRRATQALRKRPSPGRTRPTRTGPARHTAGHAERHPSAATPGRPRPKPTTPRRRPTSPVGRALNASRQTVKAALNRVRTAARTLGRKLLNSKLGRALTNGAHKIRDAYRKQRDRLRAWNQKRQQQRAQRRAHENSPEAKNQRLAAILARLRPKLHRLLGRGLPDRVLGAVLRALRVWYRLTGLEKVGSSAFHVLVTLNPQETAVDGIDVDIADRVILMINRIGEEYRARALQANGGAQPQPASGERDTSALSQLVSQRNMERRQTSERFEVDANRTAYQASGIVQSIPAREQMNFSSYVEYRDRDQILASVRRDQGPSYSGKVQREDQLVHWTSREGGALKSAALKHNEWTDKLENEWTPAERRALATSALSVITGGNPAGPHQQNAAELAQWHFEVEGGRDPATFALTTMGLDMASRGRGRLRLGNESVDYSDLANFARDFPMRELKAKKIRKGLHKHLETVQNHWNNPVGVSGNPRKRPLINSDKKAGQEKSDMRRRQLRIFRAWLTSVDDLKAWAKELEGLAAESREVVEARLAQLEKLVRARLEKLWEQHSGSSE
ncbi:hypothetical protein ABZ449_06590, partial [Kitasatospora sp. NPDC005856]